MPTRLAQLDPTTRKRVIDLLYADARDWWYHRELRSTGQTAEARRREHDSVRNNVQSINAAVYGVIARNGSGWTLMHRGYTTRDGTARCYSSLSGYGGIEDLHLQAAVLAGVPVFDFSVPECDICTITRIEYSTLPHETNQRHGGTIDTYMQACLAAGARRIMPKDLPTLTTQ